MINFFRRLRKQLLGENKFSRYIVYAIGEIILVVFGILIALGINNWNNERISRERNSQLLSKLINELDLNIERADLLRTTENGTERNKKFSDSLLVIVKDGIKEEHLDYMTSGFIFEFNSFNLHSSSFEEMKNTGSLYSIGSDSLIKEIQLYYRLCDRDEYYTRTWGGRVWDLRHECFPGWHDFKLMYQAEPLKAIEQNPWIYEQASNYYRNLRQYIAASARESELGEMRLKRIIERSEILKKFIEDELILRQ
jgi:hypothetical protein